MKQVMASVAASWQAIEILRGDGARTADIRPLVRLNVTVMVEANGKMETGSYGSGGRIGYETLLEPEHWKASVDEALRQALVNLDSVPAPAGEMQVVLGPGWPGILLHEAIGHGLEGDFNRKKTSAFSGLMGQRVAAKGVTVVDDGTLGQRRGSLTIDDEGTPTQCTTMIEDGILVGYIQDRQNARLMGMKPTGNGRRQSFAHNPMPRMTNTIMMNGPSDPKEIIGSVKKGLYAVNFGGGQGRYRVGQVRVLGGRGLSDRGRQDRPRGQGCHPDRQRSGRADQGRYDRQRHDARSRHRHLRQGRPGRAGRRRTADPADRRVDGGAAPGLDLQRLRSVAAPRCVPRAIWFRLAPPNPANLRVSGRQV